MKDILIGLVSAPATIAKDNLGIVIIENTLDILGSLSVVRVGFVELADNLFGRFQVRCGAENFIDRFITAEKRQTLILIASVVPI